MEHMDIGNDMVLELLEEADAAADASGVYTNSGKLSAHMQCYAWKDGNITAVTPAEYKALPTSTGAKQIDVVIAVDIQELKPELTFSYERKTTYRKKDWYQVLKPSVAVALNLGGCAALKDEALETAVKALTDQEVFQALMGINGKYVFVSDVPSRTGNMSASNKPIKTVRLDQVFDTRADFVAAYEAKFKTTVTVSAPSEDVPPGYNNWSNFVADVVEMRREGTSDAAIAEDLSVSAEWVAKVK